MEYSVYFVLLTCCALSHGFVVPMSFHKQTEPIKPSLDILSQTLEVATTTEASNYQFVGIDPKISGFLKPPMPTPAGLTRLPGQFQNVFDVLQEFVKDPGDQNSTVLNDSIDQVGLNSTSKIDSSDQVGQNSTSKIYSSDQVGQNSTIKIDSSDQVIKNSTNEFNSSDQIRPNSTKIETNYLNNQNSTVITESQDMNEQSSTDEIDSKDRNNQNSTVTIDSIDRISLNSTDRFIDSNDESGQNFTIIIDSQDRDSQKQTVTNDSIGQIVHNSSVVIESKDETEQNSIITIDSIDRNKFNTTKGTSDEMLQPLEAINSFVVSDVIQSDVDIQNNSDNPQSVTHNVTTEEDNVFSKMTLEQWLNMAGELQQVIQNETTIPIDGRNLKEANDAVQINEASLNETNPLTAGIYSTKYLAELPLTLSLRTTFSDSTNGLNNFSAEFINGIDGNVSNLSVAQNISEKFTAIGQITVTTVSPELSDDSLRKLISSEGVTNHTINYNNLVTTDIMTEESVVSPSVLISENSYTSVGEYFADPYQVRPMDISERSGRDAVITTSMIPNENILGGVSKINSFEAVPTNGNVSVEYSPAVTEHLTLFQNNGSMQTNTASTLSPGIEALPGESFDTSSNSTLATVSPKDTIPIDGMSMITVSLPVTNDTMENFDSIRSKAPLSFHLSSLTADVLDAIDLDHLSTHTIEPTKQNKTVLNPIYHIPGEIYPNLDEMKAQFIEDAEEIPLEVQAEISEGILSTLSQNTTTQNFTSIPVTTGTSVIEKLKLSSLTQPDDSTTIATVSEIIVTSQYINLPTRYPSTNAVDASGIIHIPTSTSKSEEIISESPILGNIQLAKLSQNNSDDEQETTINQLSSVSVPEKIYYLLRSDLVEDPTESEDINADSIAHPLENFLIPINFTSNETKVTFAETTPASQLTVIPLQKFDAKTSLFEITTSTPISESGNISHPFTNSPVVNPGVFSSISTNNLSNGTGQSIEREFASVSSEINKDNTHLYNDLVTLDDFHTQTVKTAIISETVNYYNTRPTPDANTESFLTTNDNSSVKLYPTFPENIFTANDKPSANNNAEFMPVANISYDYSINNLASEISTLNSNGVENTNKTFPLFTVEQNSTLFVPPVSNPQNISDINDLSNVFLKRDNVLDTSLFLINRKPYDPEHSHDFNPSISETEMGTFSLNHSVPTNEEDGPLRIPLMIPNSAYIPPSDDHSELEPTIAPVIENNADAILGLESASIKSINSTVGPEVTSGIDIVNDSLEPSIKNSTFTSSSNPETIPNPTDLKNGAMPTVFSGYDAYLPSQNLTNSSYSTFPNILNFSADLESDVNLSPVTNQNIQLDDSNVFSVHNPSTIGVISVNGPILISEATVDYNTAFINSERQHDSIPTPVFINDDSYKNLGPPLISSYQLTNQNSEIANNESIDKENPSHVALSYETPHSVKESLNIFPKSVFPEIHVDSTHIDTNISPPIQITPYSYNINNNFLKVPFNPEATIRFTRIDNFINDEVNSNASSSVASDNKESMLDSLHDINIESSGIEQLQPLNNNLNTTAFISVSSEPKTLFSSNRSTINDTSIPQTIITSSHDTVTLTPETNTRPAIINSTTLAGEPTNTENTTDLEMTNINDGLESTNKTLAAKNYLKTLGDSVVKGFHSMTKVFRPSESNKINVSDVLQKTVGLEMSDQTDSVLIQKDILSGSPATNDSAPISNANTTLTSNPELSDSYVNQNTYITQPHTMINTAIYPADLSDTLRRKSTNDTVQFPTDFTPSTITDEATLLLINMENTDDNNNFIYQKTTNSNPASIQEISAQPNIENTQQPTFTENRQIVNLTNISDKASLTNIPAKTMYGQIIPEDTVIAAILKKEQVNVLEHPKAITTQIQITSRNYETTPFPVVMVANNPLQTFDQRVTEFLLNHNIITTTTKPDLPQSDDDIAYSHVENINPTLQSVETPTYIYNDIDTPSKTLLVNQSTPQIFAGSQPTQKTSPSFEKPLNPIAETNFALFGEEPIILNSDYVESIANVPTANVQNSQQVEHFSPNSPANFEPSIENLTSFSDVNSAVGPQTVLNPNYVGFSENAPTIVPNLPIIQNVNQFPPASESVIEPTINFIPSFVESSSNDPAIVSQNLQMEENMNHFSPGHLEVVEQQTVLNPSYIELTPNTQATVVQKYPVFENFNKNSQASQILISESLSISPLIKVSNSSKVDELGHQTFLTNSADPASPIILIPNISIPPPNTPSLIKLNPLVLENLPSTLITNSATNTHVSNMASNSSALENSSLISPSDSDNAYYLDLGKVENLSPVEKSSSFETLTPILSPNSAPILKSQVSDFSTASSMLYPILLNNFETSNAENVTDSGIIQVGSYDNTSNLNATEIPADIFNVFSG